MKSRSLSLDPTLRGLIACGCRGGTGERSPVSSPITVENRPGLAEIAYRVGTHARFKATMLARLASPARWREAHPGGLNAPGRPWPLDALHVRDDADFTIALVDAWAVLADVLTFYQERIANEAYLRTATERFSLLHLARLIGYELRPGVAASTDLAFLLEDAPGAPGRASIPASLKVQSIPGQDELPQTFETDAAFEARAAWNVLRPRTSAPWTPARGDRDGYLTGIATGLRKGDWLLFVGAEKEDTATSDRWDARRLLAVEPYPTLGQTRIAWEGGLGATSAPPREPAADAQTHAFRQRAAIFGHNAADWHSLSDTTRAAYLGKDDPAAKTTADERKEWPDYTILAPENTTSGTVTSPFVRGKRKLQPDTIDLDNVYSQVTPGSWLLLVTPDDQELFQIKAVTETTRSEFFLTAKVTRVTLRGDLERLKDLSGAVREATVYVQSEHLPRADRPIEDPATGERVPVDGDAIELDRALDQATDGLREGHDLIVVGEDADTHQPASEKVRVFRTEAAGAATRLVLSPGLKRRYDRASLKIYGNVVPATHGETVAEVLGGGDGRQAFQRFQLRQPPLTYMAAAVESGAESTLQLRVNDLLWHETPTLYGRGPDERVYTSRRRDDGTTIVQFGDGKTGARLPSGQENVAARYRKGIGLAGNVRAGQLSLLAQRPLGVREVLNPQAAAGADDPESRDDARRNAPLTVLTLGRIVSLQDYEDFASAFGGVGKASATWTYDGERRAVFVTVAGPGGARIPDDSTLYDRLLTAMRAGSDPFVPLRVASYRPATFRLRGTIQVAPDYLPERVLLAVERTLREAFGFERRAFGQGVALSQVVAAIQAVAGVRAVVLDALYRTDQEIGLNQRLTAATPAAGSRATEGAEIDAAELLTLDSTALGLGVIA